jgi:mannose-6-phosphate isomerase-like protein (cupin superfamily)
MPLPVVKLGEDEMLKGLARFSELDRCRSGLPDMELPEGQRAFLNVLGFDQPEDEAYTSPFGDEAKAAVGHLRAGFGVSFIECEPGKGVLMHNHATVETFLGVKGRWLIEWEGQEGNRSVVLGPLDFFACPVGVQRRFECLEAGIGETTGLLLGVVEGNAPAAEFSPGAWKRIEAFRSQHAVGA